MSADECMAFAGIVILAIGFIVIFLLLQDDDRR